MAREQVYELDRFAALVLNIGRSGWVIEQNNEDGTRVDVLNIETGERVNGLPINRLYEQQLLELAAGAD